MAEYPDFIGIAESLLPKSTLLLNLLLPPSYRKIYL